MIPMRTSTIFKSRWMALLWSAGIIWFAYDFAAPDGGDAANDSAEEVQITGVDAAPVTPEEARQLEDVLNRV